MRDPWQGERTRQYDLAIAHTGNLHDSAVRQKTNEAAHNFPGTERSIRRF
ncbi:MAG: hypothetical protein WDK95_04600 [Syntrophorhabdaceae bacterium]|nr:hypothetical protein [Syntrophorhabdaceae bacterium]